MTTLPPRHPNFRLFHHLAPREMAWMLCWGLMLATACLAPSVAQDPAYHHFADQGHWAGIAHPMDVLSNLPFGLFGLLGLGQIAKLKAIQARDGLWSGQGTGLASALRCAQVFCVGLIMTTLGSAYYHLNPQDATLLWDRLGMAVAFVGVLSLLAATQVSERAAHWTLALGSVGAAAAIGAWQVQGNLLPWVVLQAGGLLLILAMGLVRPATQGAPLTIRWGWLVLAYGLAKVFELQDHQVAQWLEGAFTGHAIKHLLASAAALPVLWGLYASGAGAWNRDKRQRSSGSVTINTTTKRHT